MRHAVWITIPTSLLLMAACGSESVDESVPLRTQLETAYQAFLDAATTGSESKLAEAVTPFQISKFRNTRARRRVLLDEETIRGIGKNALPIARLPFVETRQKGDTAALVYKVAKDPVDGEGIVDVDYYVARFARIDGSWLFDGSGGTGYYLAVDDGVPIHFDESALPEYLKIDGVVREAEAPIPIRDFDAIFTIESFGYKTHVFINDIEEGNWNNIGSQAFVSGGLARGENRIVLDVTELDAEPKSLKFEIQRGDEVVFTFERGADSAGRYEETLRLP
jgi:hypothetical protein